MPRFECEDCGQRWRASSSRRCPECGSRDIAELVESGGGKSLLRTLGGCLFGPIFLFVVCGGILGNLGGSGNQPKAPSQQANDQPAPQKAQGEPGFVANNRHEPAWQIAQRGDRASIRKSVYGGLSDKAADEFMDYLVANNQDAANRMIQRGEVIPVPQGTAVDVLRTGILTYRVRIVAGPEAGIEVVVPSEVVRK